jgi:hypothetical protein
MSVRLIATDEELMIVFRVLLSEYRERTRVGKVVIFLPWKFVLPEEKIEIKDKKKFLVKKTGEKVINFSFEGEETDIDAEESLRMLGVTLYHLVTGKSELTHESFLLDGYRRSLNSTLWPIILLLLRKEEQDIDQIEKMIDAIDPKELKAEIEPPKVAPPAGTGKIKTADDIIRGLAGEKIKIIGHEGVANFWGITVPQDIRIRYSEETLREAIAANQNGEQWALAFYSGMSLRQMREKKGTNKSNQPCFYNNDWWLKSSEDSWATKNMEPGYYLLNFNGKFANKKWSDQEGLTTALGSMYERAHENVVSETVISNFGVHNGERLLENWYHWGKETDSGGGRVCVGDFGSDGFDVAGYSPGSSHDRLRVVVFRKFDF